MNSKRGKTDCKRSRSLGLQTLEKPVAARRVFDVVFRNPQKVDGAAKWHSLFADRNGPLEGEPLEDRVCRVCICGPIEDEMHVLLDCYQYRKFREQMLSSIMVRTEPGMTYPLCTGLLDWLEYLTLTIE